MLLAPALAIAVHRDREIDNNAFWVAVVIVVAVVALVIWLLSLWEKVLGPVLKTKNVDPKRGLYRWEWPIVLSGGIASGVAALAAPRYLGLVLAWAATLLVVLLATWLRGEIGDMYNEDTNQPVVRYGVMSLAATMLLMVPAWLAFAVVQPLEDSVVCGKRGIATVTGLYIGESKERVYVGLPGDNRVQVIQASGVERVVVGDGVVPDDCD